MWLEMMWILVGRSLRHAHLNRARLVTPRIIPMRGPFEDAGKTGKVLRCLRSTNPEVDSAGEPKLEGRTRNLDDAGSIRDWVDEVGVPGPFPTRPGGDAPPPGDDDPFFDAEDNGAPGEKLLDVLGDLGIPEGVPGAPLLHGTGVEDSRSLDGAIPQQAVDGAEVPVEKKQGKWPKS